ncbi:MAG: fructose-1,6-bisphosphatase I [Chloroflexi bacterium]|nr:MAG: fructose-1,6-bisphosphatase I [Chloroflexota bacterium]
MTTGQIGSSGSPLGDTLGAPLDDVLMTRLDPAEAAAGLGTVIGAIAAGAIAVEQLTRQAALAGVLGDTGEINVQGELVQQLDAQGTQVFVDHLRESDRVAGLACEELEAMVHVSDAADHPYLALFDPVDGSSNIDVGITIGSIFAIYRRSNDAPVTEATLRRPGRDQIAACYAIYGSSTVLVVATRAGVDGFTLDPNSPHTDARAFRLTHPGIRIPEKVSCYSVNEGNQDRWTAPMQQAVASLRGRYSLRYVGSLVADFHRNLLKGGIFLYPGDLKSPAGKLRLGYEANPLTFVAAQAGGAGSDGAGSILDLMPEALHQRTPLIVGNADLVAEVDGILAS